MKYLSFFFITILPLVVLAQHDYPVRSVVEPLEDYDVLAYDMNWSFEFSPSFSYRVQERVTLEILHPITQVIFDCVGLEINSCQEASSGEPLTFRTDSEALYINLPRFYTPGESVTLEINFRGSSSAGFYSTNNRYGARIYFTLCFASTARYVFPCVDDPGDKAIYSCEASLPQEYRLATNGRLIGEEISDSIYRCAYEGEHPMATYLFAIHIFPYSVWHREREDGTPIEVYYYPRDSARVFTDFARVPLIVDYFETLFGEYPFEKIGYAECPVFSGWGAMENQTMISFGDRLIDGRRTYESVVAHELSHQWFGDAITIADWRDFWLNEGFAQYAELLFIEHFYPALFAPTIDELRNDFFEHEPTEGRFPLYDPEVYLGYTVYYKGALVLHTLRFVLGDSLFFTALKNYYYTYRYRNVTTDSFMVVCENTSGISLRWFFEEWVYSAGYPELEYYFRNVEDTTKIYIRQIQRDAPIFRLPLEVKLVGSEESAIFRVWIAESVESLAFVPGFYVTDVVLDPNSWILMKTHIATYLSESQRVQAELELFAYPNPFNSELLITIKNAEPGNYRLAIHNIEGKLVKAWELKILYEGTHKVAWEPAKSAGDELPSGVYFATLAGKNLRRTTKLLLLK